VDQPVRLTARSVGVWRDVAGDEDIINVGLAEWPDFTGWKLMLMRGVGEYDDQDRALGQDTYCIVAGDQSGTVYGGITSWSATGRRLEFRLTERAARGDPSSPCSIVPNVMIWAWSVPYLRLT
jgi:hypothetical protein